MREYMFAENRKLSHSQNFFRRARDVERLLDRSGIGAEDLVIEIGPGRGMITECLAKRAGRVVAVEVDPVLAGQLHVKFHGRKNIEIIQADFLRWPLPSDPYKVFANIPFNMTADMLKRLLFSDRPPLAVYVVMQRQAALKYVGRPL